MYKVTKLFSPFQAQLQFLVREVLLGRNSRFINFLQFEPNFFISFPAILKGVKSFLKAVIWHCLPLSPQYRPDQDWHHEPHNHVRS